MQRPQVVSTAGDADVDRKTHLHAAYGTNFRKLSRSPDKRESLRLPVNAPLHVPKQILLRALNMQLPSHEDMTGSSSRRHERAAQGRHAYSCRCRHNLHISTALSPTLIWRILSESHQSALCSPAPNRTEYMVSSEAKTSTRS